MALLLDVFPKTYKDNVRNKPYLSDILCRNLNAS